MAESFGADVDRYDRARPPYPNAMVEWIVLGSPGPEVLDVGAGTGIEARQFQAAGCTVLGVEPDDRMAEFARRSGVTVETATFEGWDPAGRRFDAVIAGTAWHWVDPEVGAAKAAQVLRPGGRLALFWHVFQLPDTVAAGFAAACQRVAPESPVVVQPGGRALDGYQGIFDKASDGIRRAEVFGQPEQWPFEWEVTYTRDQWLDQLPTHGTLTRLSPERQAEVLAEVGAVVDAMGGRFTASYTTMVITARLSASGRRPG